ncbi:MAG: type II toxin-antitoxin system RelE/ParE family toxin [Paracoccaceae bacterium]|nr:type II toxin-antitoxin system RelE/ParE family toxin [Paracoccaceae bacterium]MDE2918122.1 type II toxin-antitoxin system RelE/ParE family toxin [Paracoccaceae bacterium]
MDVVENKWFSDIVKKLHKNQKNDLDEAVSTIRNNPNIGKTKVADLKGVQVYKFRMVKQTTLLAYTYIDQTNTITLLALGPRENFYRDLKKHLNST